MTEKSKLLPGSIEDQENHIERKDGENWIWISSKDSSEELYQNSDLAQPQDLILREVRILSQRTVKHPSVGQMKERKL